MSSLSEVSNPVTVLDAYMIFAADEVDQSIPQRFESLVGRFPQKLAVSTRQGQFSYDYLNRNANRVARSIISVAYEGKGPVAVFIDQGEKQITATLATLKAGRFYIPLDPENPVLRNKYMLQDSGAQIVVTDNKNIEAASNLVENTIQLLNIDSIHEAISDSNLARAIPSTAIAYILYTTGSTGNPKGVIQTHRNVLHNTMRHTNAYRISPSDRQTLLYTASVYGGQRDMYNALLNGASLHVYVVKKEGLTDLAEWLENNEVTIYCSVATIFRQFAKILTRNNEFHSVRLIKLGGEATYRVDVEAYQRFFPGDCVMHCGLGSTETGLARSYFVNHSTVVDSAVVPLGYPAEGIEVQLLGESNQLVTAPGVVGEITIKSRFISPGYWRKPEITSRVFSSSPEDPEFIIYRTGDLGCLDANGCLEHRGRNDFQIKIRGNRVEVAEVEMALLNLNSIKEAVVVGWKSSSGVDKLIAYIVRGIDNKLTAAELRTAVAKTLPEYMVPSYFIDLAALPLTPNGKVDRMALPEPDSDRHAYDAIFAPARTPMERKLVDIWSQALDILATELGVHDDFFELGGDSLGAMTLFADIDKTLGVDLPVSLLIEHPTIHDFARILDENLDDIQWPTLLPIKKAGAAPPLFCVHGVFGADFFCSNLATLIREERPLYALQSIRRDGKYFDMQSVEEIAENYLSYIKVVQPHGPYYLAGFSFGGNVVLEMALRLSERGEQVAELIIFDSRPPTLVRSASKGLLRKIAVLPQSIVGYFEKANAVRQSVGVQLGLSLMLKAIRLEILHNYLRFGASAPVKYRDDYLAWNHLRLAKRYHPERYSHNVVLFYTEGRQNSVIHGWEILIEGELKTYLVPGDHDTFFHHPNVSVLVDRVNELLAG